MVINGWRLYTHPLFSAQLTRLTKQAEALARKDPVGYRDEAATKLLATINRYTREIIPRDPNAAEFRQGNTWGRIIDTGSAPSFTSAIVSFTASPARRRSSSMPG